jgi:hypothetical protein
MKTNKLINSSIVVPTSSEQPDPSLRIRFCSSSCQHYKTFFFVYDAKGIQARVFVPGSQGKYVRVREKPPFRHYFAHVKLLG